MFITFQESRAEAVFLDAKLFSEWLDSFNMFIKNVLFNWLRQTNWTFNIQK